MTEKLTLLRFVTSPPMSRMRSWVAERLRAHLPVTVVGRHAPRYSATNAPVLSAAGQDSAHGQGVPGGIRPRQALFSRPFFEPLTRFRTIGPEGCTKKRLYQAAIAAVRANTNCIRSQGIPVTEAVVTGEKVTPGSAGPFASDADMERATKVMQERNATYLNAVGLRWYLQNAPSAETFAAARAELAACLAAAGVAVGQKGDGTPDFAPVAQSDPERFSPCSARVSEQFGIPNFAG